MSLQSIRLEFIEGTSCKEYRLSIDENGGQYDVLAAWGRIGSTLQSGVKASGVTLPDAQKAYDKILKEKTAKGYVADGSGSAASGIGSNVVRNTDQRDTGLYPQLLVAITEEEAEAYITDDRYGSQKKYNGRRMTVKKDSSEVIAINKKGLSVGFPDAIAEAVKQIQLPFVGDGEAIGDRLYAFDLLERGLVDLRPYPYSTRWDELNDLIGTDNPAVVVAPLAIGTAAKRAMYADLKAKNEEGIVFKLLDAPWSPGRPETGGPAIKCKFWSSLSCIVSSHNAKRSVNLQLEGQPIGKVTIPPNWEVPEVGKIIECKYLYVVGPGGSLYQPIYLGPRDDVDASECTFAQQKIKYKPEDA